MVMRRDSLYFSVFVTGLFLFSVGAAFFFAPFILTVGYGYVLGLMLAVAALYGYFTAEFVSELDGLTKHHHAGVWVTALIGCVLGAFLLTYFIGSTYGVLSPSSSTLVLFGLFFATAYALAYTTTVVWDEHQR